MKQKPCAQCDRNLIEAMLFDEVTCYRGCHAWQGWLDGIDRAADLLVGAAGPRPEPVLVRAS